MTAWAYRVVVIFLLQNSIFLLKDQQMKMELHSSENPVKRFPGIGDIPVMKQLGKAFLCWFRS